MERLQSKSIKNIEHDIRTPFSGILGLAQYLWETEKDITRREYLADIIHSSEQLLDYCNKIISSTQLSCDGRPLANKKFSVIDLLKSVYVIAKPSAIIKDLSLNIDFAKDLPMFVVGDEFRLYRTLINLVNNAIKFTESGSIELVVSVMEKRANKTRLRFTVKDTGKGMLSDDSYNNQDGLGLRVVKQFITEMKGKLAVRSKLGKGTTFECIVPFALPPQTPERFA